jgi:tetratricopeptide (TPR) repeat protein
MRPLLFLFAAAAVLTAETEPPHIKAALTAYESGRAAQRDKQVQRALDCFHKALEIEPTFLKAYASLIDVYLDSGHRLEAAASITQFLEIWPDAVRYRVLLGQILLEQNEVKRALAQFSLALRTDPYNPDALLGFASAAGRVGMQDRAAEAIERGRERYPLDERFKTAPAARQE